MQNFTDLIRVLYVGLTNSWYSCPHGFFQVKVSSYTARHTWATLSFHLGIPVGIISEALGHSSVRVTETYLKPFENERVDKANDKLIISVIKCKQKSSSNFNLLYDS